MKLITLLTLLIPFMVFVTSVSATDPKSKLHFKNMKKISLKCDVVFVGGRRTVLYHYDLPVKQRSTFESQLIKMRASSKNKIYRINECVDINKKFDDPIANRLHTKIQASS